MIRPEQIHFEPWWPRWISIDWGFEHPAAVYWHTARVRAQASSPGMSIHGTNEPRIIVVSPRTITYREFIRAAHVTA